MSDGQQTIKGTPNPVKKPSLRGSKTSPTNRLKFRAQQNTPNQKQNSTVETRDETSQITHN